MVRHVAYTQIYRMLHPPCPETVLPTQIQPEDGGHMEVIRTEIIRRLPGISQKRQIIHLRSTVLPMAALQDRGSGETPPLHRSIQDMAPVKASMEGLPVCPGRACTLPLSPSHENGSAL